MIFHAVFKLPQLVPCSVLHIRKPNLCLVLRFTVSQRLVSLPAINYLVACTTTQQCADIDVTLLNSQTHDIILYKPTGNEIPIFLYYRIYSIRCPPHFELSVLNVWSLRYSTSQRCSEFLLKFVNWMRSIEVKQCHCILNYVWNQYSKKNEKHLPSW